MKAIDRRIRRVKRFDEKIRRYVLKYGRDKALSFFTKKYFEEHCNE